MQRQVLIIVSTFKNNVDKEEDNGDIGNDPISNSATRDACSWDFCCSFCRLVSLPMNVARQVLGQLTEKPSVFTQGGKNLYQVLSVLPEYGVGSRVVTKSQCFALDRCHVILILLFAGLDKGSQ